MIAALALGIALAAEAHHVDASLDLAGELLDHRFVDLDGDGRRELVLALRMKRGGRELRFHRVGDARVEPEPYATVRVLEDVLAYGFADVREEAGRELLLLTRSGVFSYSITKEGYRDNAARLFESELVYDVPDRRALPFWGYTIPFAGGDLVLVPAMNGLEVWGPPGPDAEGTTGYRRVASLFTPVQRARRALRDEDVSGRRRHSGISFERSGEDDALFADAFPDEAAPRSDVFLQDSRSMRAPALVDLDRDGALDLVLRRDEDLAYFENEGGRFSAEPTRAEAYPDYLTSLGREVDLRLVDLDGDGDLDLLAESRAKADGFENVEHTLLVLLSDREHLFPAAPTQILRFEAGVMRAEVVDVNGDGRPDLAVRLFELPSLVQTVTSIQFELTHLLYLGTGDAARPFGRKPAMKRSETFDENSVGAAAANRTLRLDCDGDGTPDLVEVDLAGYVAMRRLRHESSFFGGESWELDEAPWKRFPVRGSIASLEVLDLNGDSLADVVSASDESLAILMSVRPQRGGGAR